MFAPINHQIIIPHRPPTIAPFSSALAVRITPPHHKMTIFDPRHRNYVHATATQVSTPVRIVLSQEKDKDEEPELTEDEISGILAELSPKHILSPKEFLLSLSASALTTTTSSQNATAQTAASIATQAISTTATATTPINFRSTAAAPAIPGRDLNCVQRPIPVFPLPKLRESSSTGSPPDEQIPRLIATASPQPAPLLLNDEHPLRGDDDSPPSIIPTLTVSSNSPPTPAENEQESAHPNSPSPTAAFSPTHIPLHSDNWDIDAGTGNNLQAKSKYR